MNKNKKKIFHNKNKRDFKKSFWIRKKSFEMKKVIQL